MGCVGGGAAGLALDRSGPLGDRRHVGVTLDVLHTAQLAARQDENRRYGSQKAAKRESEHAFALVRVVVSHESLR